MDKKNLFVMNYVVYEYLLERNEYSDWLRKVVQHSHN